MRESAARIAIDIGGTFTDLVLVARQETFSLKLLTTHERPEQAVIDGCLRLLAQASLPGNELSLILHGTTLATNAIIERKGARTALLVTKGHRDSLETGYEDRFDQYDLGLRKPRPLVPRQLRWPIEERIDAKGKIRVPLDEAGIGECLRLVERHAIESLAIGFLHSYANPQHEQRAAEILRKRGYHLPISLSSEVCPEIREYERLSTTVANAYIKPLIGSYLARLRACFTSEGIGCPMMLMLSGGGLTTVETAQQVPIRLVESGPAGGAALASAVARTIEGEKILSFDMGGTTAKICFVDGFRAEPARLLEVGRQNRFIKGSGIPLRIPAIQMVEIGAGGGSIARVDAANRIQVGPESAGSEPGPASYGRGGTKPTVTDADLLLGAIDAHAFANGTILLEAAAAEEAIRKVIAEPLELGPYAAYGVREVVDETMAMAARAHAVELGKELASYTLVAFGGAGPLHAARLAQKLGVTRILVPPDAGVGSAVGFLTAPISYDVSRSLRVVLGDFDERVVAQMLDDTRREAVDTVLRGSGGDKIEERLSVYARYVGQGHEIELSLPGPAVFDAVAIRARFEALYTEMYGRRSPSTQIEIMTWVYSASAEVPNLLDKPLSARAPVGELRPNSFRAWLDPTTEQWSDVPVYDRADFTEGVSARGPALVAEPQTTTVVTSNFTVHGDRFGNLILERS